MITDQSRTSGPARKLPCPAAPAVPGADPERLPAVPGCDGQAQPERQPDQPPVIYADITRAQVSGGRSSRCRCGGRTSAARSSSFAALQWHRARYHGLRLAAVRAGRAGLGGDRRCPYLADPAGPWWWVLEQHELRSQAAV